MKFNKNVSSLRRKARKAHFNEGIHSRQMTMCSPLSKELQRKHSIRSLPIRREDEVLIKRGPQKGRSGKVVSISWADRCIYIEGIQKEKSGGRTVPIGICASNVVITKPSTSASREKKFSRLFSPNTEVGSV